ncbi:Rrf2 family transcriptional regulator [Caulobacter sp. DWR3-1-2]|uniref:Rrf2 family transcriptional regulator n=1 Tax=Caulobacter sp. DWR3-1-2 TaxID=2804647 RepID=UPI003CF70D88
MQLTVFTDFGLRSLMFLASRPQSQSSVREIAEHYGISRNHLVKVVHRLAQLGYITSSKGRGGGIRLAHDPVLLRIGDIVQKLEPHMQVVECFDAVSNTCKITATCELKHILHEGREAFVGALNKYTLADASKGRQPFLFEPSASAASPETF